MLSGVLVCLMATQSGAEERAKPGRTKGNRGSSTQQRKSESESEPQTDRVRQTKSNRERIRESA